MYKSKHHQYLSNCILSKKIYQTLFTYYRKLSNRQTVYVTLPKKDYVESASEKVEIEEEKSWWEKIADKIFNF